MNLNKITRHPEFWVALAWAIHVHLALARLLVPDSAVSVLARFAAMALLLAPCWKLAGRHWTGAWNSLLAGLFLIPSVALIVRGDFLPILGGTAVVAGVWTWWSVCSLRSRKSFQLADALYVLFLSAWGFYLCVQILGVRGDFSGWWWQYSEDDWMPKIGDDGVQYIHLGQNLSAMLATMHRLPGYPLITRFLFMLSAPNVYVFIISNILCLLATAHLVTGFAIRLCAHPWTRAIFLVPLVVYFSGFRLEWYSFVLTDPLHDLLMTAALIRLYDLWTARDRSQLKIFWLMLLLAFSLRPTIFYFAITAAGVMALLSWRQKAFALAALRSCALFFLLPVFILATSNRLRHGVFTFSSMPAHVLARGTYGTMMVLDGHFPDYRSSRAPVNKELEVWHRAHPAPGLSGDGITAIYDSAFAKEKFKKNPELFARALWAGFKELLFHGGQSTDAIILTMAIMCALSGGAAWMLLLLWPLYLIPVYSLEGFGMEYRLTLQLMWPCLMIVIARLAQRFKKNEPTQAGLWTEPVEIRATWVWAAAIVSIVIGWMFLLWPSTVNPPHLLHDVQDHLVAATTWDSVTEIFSYRKRESWGRLTTVEVTLAAEDMAPELEAALRTQDLIPRGYTQRFIALPRRAERAEFLHRSEEMTTATQTWNVSLLSLNLAQLQTQMAPHQSRIHLLLAPWLRRWLTFGFTFAIDWQKNSCVALVEQTRIVEANHSNVYTSLYDSEKKQRRQWTDRYLTNQGSSMTYEEFPLAPAPSESLCALITEGARETQWHFRSGENDFTLIRDSLMTRENKERVVHLHLRERPEVDIELMLEPRASGWRLRQAALSHWPLTVTIRSRR